jgi:hypothetical protein
MRDGAIPAEAEPDASWIKDGLGGAEATDELTRNLHDWRTDWRTALRCPSEVVYLQESFGNRPPLPKPRALVRFRSGAYAARPFVKRVCGTSTITGEVSDLCSVYQRSTSG